MSLDDVPAPAPRTEPTGPFSWHDVYRAVERSEDRIMRRLDDVSAEMGQRINAERTERKTLENRIVRLEQVNFAESERARSMSQVGSISLRLILLFMGVGQLVIAFLAIYASGGGSPQ